MDWASKEGGVGVELGLGLAKEIGVESLTMIVEEGDLLWYPLGASSLNAYGIRTIVDSTTSRLVSLG